MVKIRNKETGEIIDLSAGGKKVESKKQDTPKDEPDRYKRYEKQFNRRSAEAEERIKKRGKIQDDVKDLFGKDSSVMDRISGGLNMVAAPARSLESAISNPMLLAQQGEMDANALTREAIKRFIPLPILSALKVATEAPATDRLAEAVASGATLQRQGQYGDVLKNAGVPDGIADTTGLFLNIAGPIKIFQGVSNVYGKFANMTDKTMMNAGEHLISGVNASAKAVGAKVGAAYEVVDDAVVNGTQFIDTISNMPKLLVKAFKNEFGDDIAGFAKNLTVKKTVLVKRWLGKFRKGQWGKAERGLQESLDEAAVNVSYGGLKDIIHDGISGVKGSPYADMVGGIESAFSNVTKAGRFIKHSIINSKLQLPTKVGQFAKATTSKTDSSSRVAMDIIRRTSKEARKHMVKASNVMKRFNKIEAIKATAGKVAGAAILGGAVGAIGGGVVSKYSNE